MIMLPLAIFICAYALMVFLWRNQQIAQKQAAYIDDHRWAGWGCGWGGVFGASVCLSCSGWSGRGGFWRSISKLERTGRPATMGGRFGRVWENMLRGVSPSLHLANTRS